jgi:hypothetical protein
MRVQLALLAAIAAVFTFMTFSAQAMPAAALKGASQATEQVIQVRDGCGRDRWRDRYGRCHWDRRWHR